VPGSDLYKRIPLSFYVDKPIKVIRNDALDRFGTPLEKRFTRNEIERMMTECGLANLHFSDSEPYWHVYGTKAADVSS
jgi:hypothetical protein